MGKPRSAKARAKLAFERLSEEFPGSASQLCELRFSDPFQLLVATILSAQTTDVRVNATTPELFSKFPDAASLACANPAEVEDIIKSTGFFRNKTKSIIAMASDVNDRFGGTVPTSMEELVTLAGVGRKTANVVRSVAMELPGFAVDTHVTRLTKRLGLTTATEPVPIETEVTKLIPSRDWGAFSLRLILHGRRTCVARKPKCSSCRLADFCPSAFRI